MKKNTLFIIVLALLLILSFGVCAYAKAPYDGVYVYDEAGILTDSQVEALNSKAAALVSNYKCEVYIVTIDNFKNDGFTKIEDYTIALSDYYGMGYGSSRDCLLLILSMAERDYDLDAHGTLGDRVFTSRAIDDICDSFLDNFRNNDWYGGFRDYLNSAEKYLSADLYPPTAGEKLADNLSSYMPFVGIFALVAAGIQQLILRMQMRSVAKSVRAEKYAVDGSLVLRARRDIYTHSTTTRTKIQQNSGSSGSSGHHYSSGDHHGRSGKF